MRCLPSIASLLDATHSTDESKHDRPIMKPRARGLPHPWESDPERRQAARLEVIATAGQRRPVVEHGGALIEGAIHSIWRHFLR